MDTLRASRRLSVWTAMVIAVVALGCSSATKPVTCPAGQAACGGICFDLQANPLSCGTCLHRCPAGASCLTGVCTCPSGESVCGTAPGTCANLTSDLSNCGACGVACGLGTCASGACNCDGGTITCSVPGPLCVDTSADPANCGSCRHACPTGATCAAGVCTCPTGEIACGTAPGACVDLTGNVANCGACGAPCPTGATCASGVCRCPLAAPDTCGGACVDLQIDEANCGGCGGRCATGATCVGGLCRCPAGDVTCGAPGLCADLSTDHDHCGSCSKVCGASQSCTAGTCSCATGYAACGTACCAGNGCCAGGCQTVHSNGLGQSYYDCNPLATTGNFTLGAAQEAAQAWAAAGHAGQTVVPSCSNCYAWQTASSCAVWCYTGSVTGSEGQVTLDTISTLCLCPPQGDPKPWN